MATVYLVACANKKQNKPAPAKNLYISDLFQKSAALARREGDRWYILSAKYGLVEPGQVIEPYDQTLKRMCKADRFAWAQRLLGRLLAETQPGDTIVFLAGTAYRGNLIPELRRRGYLIVVPMEGMRIGEQKAWLKRKLAESQL